MIKTEKTPDSLSIVLQEDLTVLNAKQAVKHFKSALAEAEGDSIILDLNQIDMVDSMGLKVIIGLYQSCQTENKTLEVHTQSPAIQRIFHMCNLGRFITVHQG